MGVQVERHAHAAGSVLQGDYRRRDDVLRGSIRVVSYDLTIYTRDAAAAGQLVDLVLIGKALAVDEASDGSITVVRGARRVYSFTVGGPDKVEPEDVPIDVTAVLLGARYQWSVMVEGTAVTEIPHAIRFARRLAQALDGAVVDQQLDEVWSRSKSRTISKP